MGRRELSEAPERTRVPVATLLSGLHRGALYAMGVEIAAARLPLLSAALTTALQEGRPCVLITPLHPDAGGLRSLLERASQRDFACAPDGGAAAGGSYPRREDVSAGPAVAAVHEGRLKVFCTIGDYAVNLFLHGSAGFVRELDRHGIKEGSLIIVDQADDLFTLHDHAALVQQARTYVDWSSARQHTILMLHLRTGALHPMLEGNQAALHYFDGVARLCPAEEGPRMFVDFWDAACTQRPGVVLPLDLPLGASPRAWPIAPWRADLRSESGTETAAATIATGVDPSLRDGGGVKAAAVAEVIGAAAVAMAAGAAAPLTAWYFGPHDPALGLLSAADHGILWRVAGSLSDVLPAPDAEPGAPVLVGLGDNERFRADLLALAELRRRLGPLSRIVVRESRHRLREHVQRRLLQLAGVDAVLPPGAPLAALRELLRGEATPPPGPERQGIAPQFTDWVQCLLVEKPDARWLPAIEFADEAELLLLRTRLLQLPFTLVEMYFEAARDAQASQPPLPARIGDMATTVADGQLVLLRGCREDEAMQVIARCMVHSKTAGLHLRRLDLFGSEAAIDERLSQLRRQLDDERQAREALPALVAVPTVLARGPAPRPSGAERPPHAAVVKSATGFALAAALGVGLWAVASNTLAQPELAAAPALSTSTPVEPSAAANAYNQGRYAEAARLGLTEVARDPHNHTLRFQVANSLAWTGRYDEAIRQYEALAGTSLANDALLGLANVHLWDGRPEVAAPLYQRVLAAQPGRFDAQDGLAKAGRHLRPRSTLRLATIEDSDEAERRVIVLAHRWRSASLEQVFEISAEGGREERVPDVADLEPRELGFVYEHLGLPLRPRLHIQVQDSPVGKWFGGVAVKLAAGAVTLDVARVNWGKEVFAPPARRDGLSARRVGVAAAVDTTLGRVQGSAVQFDTSDDNRVREISLRVTPAWQPLPAAAGVKLFAGLYSREARRTDPRYWAPADGYYTGDLGAALGRWEAEWDLYGEAKRSLRLGGEGSNGWALSLGGRRWLGADWSLRAEAMAQESRREGSGYRSRSFSIALDRLW